MAGTRQASRKRPARWLAAAALVVCGQLAFANGAGAETLFSVDDTDHGPVNSTNNEFTYTWGWNYTSATGNAADIVVNNSLQSEYSGVGRLLISRGPGNFLCSGTLLGDRRSVLTAAHCVTDSAGVFDTNSTSVTFQGPSGDETLSVTDFNVHPDWDGDFIRGNDLAVLTLEGEPTNQIADYDIFTGSNEIDFASVEKVGFGRSGTGAAGDFLGAGVKRAGANEYDAVADTMLQAFGLTAGTDFVAGSVLQYDFDNGATDNDAFDFFFDLTDTGLGGGLTEVMSAPGDSGGPTFIDVGGQLQVAGVTSYGISLAFSSGPTPLTSDVDGGILNSSFGEFAGDTRVSSHEGFITASLTQSTPIPTPASASLFLLGLGGLALMGRRRRGAGIAAT